MLNLFATSTRVDTHLCPDQDFKPAALFAVLEGLLQTRHSTSAAPRPTPIIHRAVTLDPLGSCSLILAAFPPGAGSSLTRLRRSSRRSARICTQTKHRKRTKHGRTGQHVRHGDGGMEGWREREDGITLNSLAHYSRTHTKPRRLTINQSTIPLIGTLYAGRESIRKAQ